MRTESSVEMRRQILDDNFDMNSEQSYDNIGLHFLEACQNMLLFICDQN